MILKIGGGTGAYSLALYLLYGLYLLNRSRRGGISMRLSIFHSCLHSKQNGLG